MEYVKTSIDVSDLPGLAQLLERERQASTGDIGQGFAAAGLVYMGFSRERFVTNSRGGGNWPALAPSTLRGRRRGGASAEATSRVLAARGVAPRSAAILIDTATLIGSITPGTHATETIPGGIRVGTEVGYAVHHQQGGPGLPQREIFVQPDRPTASLMQTAIERGYQQAVDRFGAA